MILSLFFFNDTATTEIYTLSLHDALPIFEEGLHGISADVSLGIFYVFAHGFLGLFDFSSCHVPYDADVLLVGCSNSLLRPEIEDPYNPDLFVDGTQQVQQVFISAYIGYRLVESFVSVHEVWIPS